MKIFNTSKQELKYGNVDFNISLILKYISDLGELFKKVSPFSSLIFIILNYRSLVNNKKAIFTALAFTPAFILTPSMEILRFIFSVFVFWIFAEKLKQPRKHFSSIVVLIIILYSIIIFSGLFNPGFYVLTSDGYRYKFILESHNALCVIVFASYIYVLNFFLQPETKYKWLKILSLVSIVLLCVVFLFIKSRLYIALSFSLAVILSLQNFRATKQIVIIPLFYLCSFLLFTKLSYHSQTSELTENKSTENKLIDSKLVDNKRLTSFSTTGREKLNAVFFQTFKELGWKKFIYQNNTQAYLKNKSKIPNINLKASALTENTYFIVLLTAGFLGLLTLLFIIFYYVKYLISNKKYYSLLYFFLITIVWIFEETILFPFSMMTDLFALLTIHYYEKHSNENSHRY